jgi:hypothetical protein
MSKLLNEHILDEFQIIERDKSKLPSGILARVRRTVCEVGVKNANHRIYTRQVWEKVIGDPAFQKKMANRQILGDYEHPEYSQLKLDKDRTSHVVSNLFIDDSVSPPRVKADFDLLPTEGGKYIFILHEAGVKVPASTRADGELEEKVDESGEKYFEVVENAYKFNTIDHTGDPSCGVTEPESIVRAVQSNYESHVIGKDVAIALLESVKTDAAQALEKIIKEDQQHPECKCALGDKKCTKGCQHAKISEGDLAGTKHTGGWTGSEMHTCPTCGEVFDPSIVKQHKCPVMATSEKLTTSADLSGQPANAAAAEDVVNKSANRNKVVDNKTEGNESVIDVAKRILVSGPEKVEGSLMDAYTASAIMAVYNALDDKGKEKYRSLPLSQLLTVTWKMVGKNNEGVSEAQEMDAKAVYEEMKKQGKSDEEAARATLDAISNGLFSSMVDAQDAQVAIAKAIELFDNWGNAAYLDKYLIKDANTNEDVQIKIDVPVQVKQFLIDNWDSFLNDEDAVSNLVKGFKIGVDDAKRYVQATSKGMGTISAVYAMNNEKVNPSDAMKLGEASERLALFTAERKQLVENYARDSIGAAVKINELQLEIRNLKVAEGKVVEAKSATISQLTKANVDLSAKTVELNAKLKESARKLTEMGEEKLDWQLAMEIEDEYMAKCRNSLTPPSVDGLIEFIDGNPDYKVADQKIKDEVIKRVERLEERVVATLKETYTKEILGINEAHRRELIKTYVGARVKSMGLKLNQGVLTLLESCKDQREVDTTIKRVQSALREGLVHSTGLTEIVVDAQFDPARNEVDNKIALALKSFGI